MKNSTKNVLALAVLALLTSFAAHAGGLTRAEVTADLAAARAQGTMEVDGDGSTPSAVLQAREWAHATEARVLQARLDLDRQRQSGLAPEITAYAEEGRYGPVLVLLLSDSEGRIFEVQSRQLAVRD